MRIHPDRVRATLHGGLSDATIARLLACARLSERLDAWFGAGPVGAGDEPAWLLADPAEAVCRAGAILHGRAIRSVLTGPDVAALVAAIGREAHALGLRHGAEAPARDHGGDLAGAIRRDGAACLDAWLRTRAAPLRAAILLALPPGLVGAEVSDAVDAEAVMESVARSFTPQGDAKAGSGV